MSTSTERAEDTARPGADERPTAFEESTAVVDAAAYRLDVLETDGTVFVSTTVDRAEAQRIATHRTGETVSQDAEGVITIVGAATNIGPRTHVLTPTREPDAVGAMPQYAEHPGIAEALEILRAAGVRVATVPARKTLYREWHSPQGPQGAFIWPGPGRTLEVSWFIDGAQDEGGMRSRDTRTVRLARNKALDDIAGAFRGAGWTVWRVASSNTATRRALRVDVTPPAEEEPSAVISEEEAEALVAEFGIGEGDLDEAVYDAANEYGADEYNDGAHPELSEDDAYDEVHDAADERASSVNNHGVTAQVQFLGDFCGTVEALRSLLRDRTSPPTAGKSPAASGPEARER
jgi:hypothetical protein